MLRSFCHGGSALCPSLRRSSAHYPLSRRSTTSRSMYSEIFPESVSDPIVPAMRGPIRLRDFALRRVSRIVFSRSPSVQSTRP